MNHLYGEKINVVPGLSMQNMGTGNLSSVDHISPGGKTVLSNLRPLQWRNNVDKSNGRLKGKIVASPFNGVHLNKSIKK